MPNDSTSFCFHAALAAAALPCELLLRILEEYDSPQRFFDRLKNSPGEVGEGVPPQALRKLKTLAEKEKLEAFDQALKKYGIRALTFSDREYPEALRQLPDPPGILFYQGDLQCLRRRTVGMVGSRAASYNGQKATRSIAADLSRQGVVIISGLACGIDAAAHRGCLEGGSPTVAVMGCGLDRVYPADNAPLRNEILQKGGLLLSEYAPGEKPAGWHFPVRNRLISGLSHALILMEARIRSGSMTTVQHALDQGKDVFVYPGDPMSPLCEGNHQLLREGAIFFTKAEHILEDLRWLDNPVQMGQNNECAKNEPSGSPGETAVLRALQKGALSFEQILDVTSLSPSELMSALTLLQIRGVIETLPGKSYQLKEDAGEAQPPEGGTVEPIPKEGNDRWPPQSRN